MLGFRKRKQKEGNAAKARLARKILRKGSGRRVFGFPCSPDIPARIKILAGKLNIPIYALAEHMLQLSARLVAKMVDNPEDLEQLRLHIIENHVDARTVEKIAEDDEEMAEILEAEIRKRSAEENAVRQIVRNFVRSGIKPKELPWLIDFGMRCRIAVATGNPIPKDWPRET